MENKQGESNILNKKTVETSGTFFFFRKNRIFIVNHTEFSLQVVVSIETHHIEIRQNGLINKGPPIQKLIFTGNNSQSHEINIDGTKAFVSVFILFQEKSLINLFDNRLLKKESILNIKKSHVDFIRNNLSNHEPQTISIPTHINKDIVKNKEILIGWINQLMKDKKSNEWKKSKLLGSGAYGQVYLGFISNSTQLVAVKQLKLDLMQGNDSKFFNALSSFLTEIETLKMLNHVNIVKFLDVGVDYEYGTPTDLNMFLEYIPGGSIEDILRNSPLPEKSIIRFTKQILSGLEYLHSKDIIHGDIKCSNILLDQYGVVKLSDFGCSNFFQDISDVRSNGISGTLNWMAPEILESKKKTIGKPSDIWSLGCTIIQMATSKPPWSNIGNSSDIMTAIQKSVPEVPPHLSKNAQDFLSLCFKFNPNDRSTASQLMRHQFLV